MAALARRRGVGVHDQVLQRAWHLYLAGGQGVLFGLASPRAHLRVGGRGGERAHRARLFQDKGRRAQGVAARVQPGRVRRPLTRDDLVLRLRRQGAHPLLERGQRALHPLPGGWAQAGPAQDHVRVLQAWQVAHQERDQGGAARGLRLGALGVSPWRAVSREHDHRHGADVRRLEQPAAAPPCGPVRHAPAGRQGLCLSPLHLHKAARTHADALPPRRRRAPRLPAGRRHVDRAYVLRADPAARAHQRIGRHRYRLEFIGAPAQPKGRDRQPEAHDGRRGASTNEPLVPRLQWSHRARQSWVLHHVRHGGQGRVRRACAPHLGAARAHMDAGVQGQSARADAHRRGGGRQGQGRQGRQGRAAARRRARVPHGHEGVLLAQIPLGGAAAGGGGQRAAAQAAQAELDDLDDEPDPL